MIDIHTHIIPYVDDGAEDVSEALLMAELAAESGVHTIIATPHSNIPGEEENYLGAEMLASFQNMKKLIQEHDIPIRLLMGAEIFATEDVAKKIEEKKLISLNQSGHYLVEFDFYARSHWITDILEQIRETGAIPVVAHPERYICVQKSPQVVMDWIDMGCQMQMNRGSIFGSFGKYSFYAADELLHNDLITYIASDAHSPYRRTTYMEDIRAFLEEEFSTSYARRILVENPEQYLTL